MIQIALVAESLKMPLSLSRPGDSSSSTKKFKRVLPDCAYCGDEYKGKTLHDKPVILTYDHITTNSSGGSKSLANGLLACSPCNSSRGNKSLLTYLMGGPGLPLDVSGTSPENRRASFARYLRFYVENRVKLQTSERPSSWFNEALGHLISPLQSKLATPLERGKEFFGFLAKQDPDFWLGKKFADIIEEDFTRQPEKQDLLRNIVSGLRSTVVRFSGRRAA